MKLGFIGLGMMGVRMAKNILKDHKKLNIWNRTQEKGKELIEMGAEWKNSPYEIAKESDVIFLMLKDKDTVNEVIFGEKGIWDALSENKIVVDMTTTLPEYSVYLYNKFKEKKAHFLDSPVLGTLPQAENRELIIITGGDREIFEKVKSYFDSMGKKVIYVGKSGSASYLKLFINILGAVSILTLSEGLLYLEKAGIDRNLAVELINELAFGSKAMFIKGKNILENNFSPFFKLELMEKDVRYYVETSKKLGTTSFITSLTSELYRAAKNKGFKDLDFSAVYKLIKELNS